MNLLAFALLWAQSLQAWLRQQDIQLEFGESPADRPKRSCWITLRHAERESELLLWETGEAELNASLPGGDISQEHLELHELSDLGAALSRLLAALG